MGPAYQGVSVSLSADGNTAIVGGLIDNGRLGALWVWTRSGGVWTQQGTKLVGTGAAGTAAQGNSVSLSADGNTAIVGGSNDNSDAGAAWVFAFCTPPATPTPTNNGPKCERDTVQLTVGAVSGATYSWTGPNGFTSALQNPSIPSATTAATGTYSVTATVNGCVSAAGTTGVTVNSIPSTPIATNNGPLCVGGNLQLGTGLVTGTYSWNGPNGFSSTVQNPTIGSVMTAATGTYSVNVTVGGCTSPAGTTSVVINASPATPTIAGPASLIQGATGQTANVTNHAGSTYTWGITNGTISAGQGTNQITFSARAAGSLGLTVIETNATGCASPQANNSIQVTAAIAGSTRFYSLFSCRLFDTRNTTGPDLAWPALAPGETRLFTVGGRCSLPSSARSLSVNQTVTGQTASGELVLYRGDLSATPTASSITFPAGKTRANNGILDLAHDGSGTFKVFNNSTGSVHFILDVNGYFQ
jgi:hypothetical protein